MTITRPKSTSSKIHRRIILAFILTTVFSILLVGTTLRYVLEKTTMDNWKKRQEFVTLEFAPQCDFEIQEAKRDIEFVSKLPAFSNLSHIDQIDHSIKGIPENVDVEKREIFRDLMALGERFSSLIILTPDANLYLVHPFKTQIKVKRLNFANRAYFKEAVRTKKPVISDSFVSGAGNPLVIIAVPVLDKTGDITAVIGGGVHLTDLSQLVDKKMIGNFDLGFIVDKKGRLIAHTNTKLLKKEIRNRYIEHAFVSKFLHKSPQDDSEVMIEDCVDPVDGKHYLTSFVKLKSGWGLGLSLSRETILSEIRPAVWRTTILVSLIILIVGAIGVFFAQWIGRRWIGTENALIRQTHDLGERVKELDSLYGISKIVEKPDISLAKIFQGIVEIIPHSYQYPEITCSRIVMTAKEYKTKNFKETGWKQSSEIFVAGNQTGTLEVFYLEEKQEIYEGPFLKEERHLIDEIADRLRMIIERKQAEEALRESEEKYRTTLRSTPDTVAISRVEDGRFLELNDGFTRMFGYPREEAIGKTVTELDLYHLPTDRDRLVEALSTQEEANELEFTYRRKDETLFKGMQSASLIRFSDEDCLISVVKDISLLDNAQKRLQGEKLLSEEYINSLPGLFYVFDEKRFVRWNSEWNRITGYSDEELSGMYGTDFFEGEDRTLIRNRMLKVFRDGAAEVEAKLVAKDGRRIYCYFTGLRKNLNGKDHLVGFGIDITERKQAEEALRKSEDRLARSKKMESLGLLAGGVAHDLNNILSGIVTYPELLLMNLPENSPLRKPIKTIQESGMRAADVVEDLLTIARGIATGKEPLNLNTIVTEYLRSAEYQELEKTHSFVSCRTELDPDLLNMSASPTHIKKVLMNLVTNASEAIENSGTVIISTANRYLDEPLMGYEDVRMGEYSVLSVSDNGSGISPEDLERVFEPFYTKKVMGRSGTGLGLAVVWNTVQDHKGYINVKSSEEGTVFELYFPVTREQVAAEEEEIPLEDYLGNGEKILVVDDEERQREIAEVLLTKLGYVAESVSSGEEAIEYVKEHPVDLIVLDMVMPKGINGRKTYEEIIKIRPGQKAIIASGYAKTKEVGLAQELGAGKYIKKPYALAKVGIAVKEELEK